MGYGVCPGCGGVTRRQGSLCWECEYQAAVELAEDFDADELGIDPEEEDERLADDEGQ